MLLSGSDSVPMLIATSLPNAGPGKTTSSPSFAVGASPLSGQPPNSPAAPKETFAGAFWKAQATAEAAKTARAAKRSGPAINPPGQTRDSSQQQALPIISATPTNVTTPLVVVPPSPTNDSVPSVPASQSPAAAPLGVQASLSNSIGVANLPALPGIAPDNPLVAAPDVAISSPADPASQAEANRSSGAETQSTAIAEAKIPDAAPTADPSKSASVAVDANGPATPDLQDYSVASPNDGAARPPAIAPTAASPAAPSPKVAAPLAPFSSKAPAAPAAGDTTLVALPTVPQTNLQPANPADPANQPSSLATDNSAAAAVLVNRSPAQSREALLQQMTAHLQDPLGGTPESKATSTAPPGDAGNGKPTSQDGSSSQSSNAGGQSSAAQDGLAATTTSPHPSGNPNESAPKNSNSNSADAASAAGPSAAAVQQALHAPADVSLQPAGASAAANSRNPNTPSASAASPSPLPSQAAQSSASDVLRANELYQRVGSGEMHVAMQTDLLGAIDLHATMHQSTLTATIGVQRADVQTLLANDLPALQHALADQHFHVEHISVLDTSVGAHAGTAGQHGQPQNDSAPAVPHLYAGYRVGASASGELDSVPATVLRADGQPARLSIHA